MRFTALPYIGRDYSVNFLRPQNTESVEPEINKIGEKFQYKNKFIIHNDIINAGGNQITDMIQ